ncbi:HNH endonuclease [Corallococcus aberystwythensis]|uniref:HNH endonuclease n=1 Tax=Corallococcus aberystwythensis TaxID=2316722 RepID=UPI0011C4459F|nr:hypothetical protein [Corallococcus aberystwythensis]
MRSLSPPTHDNIKTIKDICSNTPGWHAHEATWLQAASSYQAAKGDPWLVNPSAFQSDISSELKDLYSSRRKGGYIKRIRESSPDGNCPLCGSLGAGTVDHYLPKDEFPEFSIFSLNLVPACTFCNSAEKGKIFRGDSAPARIIHPYFDTLANNPILTVAFEQPFEAAIIRAKPVPTLSGSDLAIVKFHIETLLGAAFQDFVRNLWTKLPLTTLASLSKSTKGVTTLDTLSHVNAQLQYNQITYGANSWPAAFYRGIPTDHEAIEYITQKASSRLLEK